MTQQLTYPGVSNPRGQGGNCNAFSDLAYETTDCHFCSVLLVAQISTDSVWRAMPQGHDRQEVRITRGIVEAGFHRRF